MSTITFLLPGLPGDDGRVSWKKHEVEYVRGRSLAGYVAADLFLEPHQVSHAIVRGEVIDPRETVAVPAPETTWRRRWRKLRDKPAPTVSVSRFDAYIPARGAEISIVPNVEGKNASVILGAIGIVAGIALAAYTGGGSLGAMGAFQAGLAGYGVGSYIGSLLTPKPKPINDDDGPTSLLWQGARNDDRAGVCKPILAGQMLVGGKRIGMVRRRGAVVPVRTGAGSYDDSAPSTASESLHLLLLIAAHPCEGPVGVTSPNLPAHLVTNKPDVRINGTHYSNYPNVEVEWRTGATSQSVMRGFDVIANTYDLAVDLTETHHTTPYVYTTVDEIDAFEVLLTMPGLSHADDTAGLQKNTTRYRLRYRKTGTVPWNNADYEGQRTLGAATRAQRVETRRIEKLANGDDMVRGRYEIELQWIDDASTAKDADRDQWHILLTGINEEVQESRNYEGESLLAIRGLATDQLSGPVPTVTSQWRGYIPRTWSVASGWSAPTWGVGTFAPPGKNPFWLAANLLLDTQIGGGDQIVEDDVDLPSVAIAAAQANTSELVVPADGSLAYSEARHQYCNYFDIDQEAQDFVQGILSTARGCLIFTGNQYRFGVDAMVPEDSNGRPILSQVFGMGSILTTGEPPDEESSFNVQYKSERHELNTFEATFPDAAADWETDSHSESIDNRDPISLPGNATSGSAVITGMASTAEISVGTFVHVSAGFTGLREVLSKTLISLTLDAQSSVSSAVTVSIGAVFVTEDDLVVAGLPVLRRKMQFVGVDRRTQIARELRFALRQTYALREFGTFGAATKAMLCEVYDVIGVSHDLTQWGFSGRVMDGCLDNLVMFDRDVDFEAGTTYEVMVHFRDPGPDGKDLIETRTVADTTEPVDGSRYFGLTVTVPFSRVPQEGEEWFYGPVDLSVKPTRIVDIDRDADDERAIAWAEYNASIYDVSGPIIIPRYSLLPDFAAPPGAIPDLQATSVISTRADARRVTDVILQCSAPRSTRTEGPFRGVDFAYALDGENWATLQSIDGLEYRWEDAPHGIHLFFRAIPYSISGKRNNAGAAFADITPEGYGAPSPVVTGIAGSYADGANVVSWSALGPEYEYEVRTANPSNWTTSTTGFLWRGKTTRFLHELPAARAIQYYVRAIDPFGNYSIAAATITITDAAPAGPTITTITRYKDGFKIKVTPPAGTTDIIAIHLHASQSSGFTPTAANRVATPVGPAGGEFLFKTSTPGNWYFKATCEDWLSQRIGDWIYSAEDDDNIVVIAPVNPTITMPAGFVVVSTLVKDIEPSGGGYKSVTRFSATITWGHTDAVNPANSVVGYEIVVYDAAVGIGSPLADTVVIDPLARSYNFPDVSGLGAANGIAAVKALYVDGLTSDFITSTGVTIPQDTNPHIQSTDDRNALAYCESFYGATLPNGFGFTGCTLSVTTNPHELTLTRTSSGICRLHWAFLAWGNEYRDTNRAGPVLAFVQMKVQTPAQLTGVIRFGGNDGDGNVTDIDVEIVNDGSMHVYRVPWGTVDPTEPNGPAELIVNLTNSGIPVGGVVRISTIGLAFQSFDLELDITGDYVINARRQFDRDPDGDGFFGLAPVRLADANGNHTIVMENGLYFLRNESGSLVTETPFKLGRRCELTIPNFGDLAWGSDVIGGSAGQLRPVLPAPAAHNKLRFLLEPKGQTAYDTVISTPVRLYAELNDVGDDGASFAANLLQGGNLGHYYEEGPWSSSASANSTITQNASNTGTTLASDGWFYATDQLPFLATSTIYFRTVVWLAVFTPTAKRTNGSYYYAHLRLQVRVGKASKNFGTNRMDFTAAHACRTYRARVLMDGTTHYVPFWFGNLNHFLGAERLYDYRCQNIKVDWFDTEYEYAPAGLITGVQIERIEWDYVTPSGVSPTEVPLSTQSYILTYLEEF